MKTVIIFVVAIIILVIGVLVLWHAPKTIRPPSDTGNVATTSTTGGVVATSSTSTASTTPTVPDITTTSVKIALLSPKVATSNPSTVRGCDVVSMKQITVPKTSAPLAAVLDALFARREKWPATSDTPGNFITSQKNLLFKSVTLESGVAKVYLTGKYGPLDTACDDARIGIQIEETAKQFASVSSVQIYINGALLPSNTSLPYITSISPTSGKVGTIVVIKGRNLAGFEGDLDAWIENTQGDKAHLPSFGTSVYPRTDQITVRIEQQLCKVDNSYSGNPCKEYLTITPRTYKIYTSPWGVSSNSFIFTVTP